MEQPRTPEMGVLAVQPPSDISAGKLHSDPEPAEAALGHYPKPPTQMELEQVLRTIRETGQPELVPTLSWTKPPKHIEHQIRSSKINVSRKLRPDDEMVPCSLCGGGHPKCLTFYLLWSSDGHLRIVGHICGAKYFGQTNFQNMEDAAQREATKRADQEYLLTHLPKLHLWLTEAEALVPVCQLAQRLRRAFGNKVPSVDAALRQMVHDHAGALVVMRKRSGNGPSGFRSSMNGGQAEYDVVTLAQLRGRSFLAASYSPVRELRMISNGLRHLARGRGSQLTEDDILEIVCAMDDDELRAAVKLILQAHRRAVRLVERLTDIFGFLSDSNLDELARWGAHPENQLGFTVTRSERSVVFRVRWDERVTLDLSADLKFPPLMHLGQV